MAGHDPQPKDADPAPAEGQPRRWPWLLLFLILGLAAVAWQYREAVAERALVAILSGAGYGPVEVHVETFNLSELHLTNIRLGEDIGVTAAAVTAHYTVDDLTARRVRTLEIQGLRFVGEWDGETLTVEGVGPVATSPDTPEPAATPSQPLLQVTKLPFDQLTVLDLSAYLRVPDGHATVEGNFSVDHPHGKGMSVSAQLGLGIDVMEGKYESKVAATAGLTPQGHFTTRMAFEPGDIQHPFLTAAKIGGTLDATVEPSGRLLSTADLRFDSLTVGGYRVTAGRAIGTVSGLAGGERRAELRMSHLGVTGPEGRLGGGFLSADVSLASYGLRGLDVSLEHDGLSVAGRDFSPDTYRLLMNRSGSGANLRVETAMGTITGYANIPEEASAGSAPSPFHLEGAVATGTSPELLPPEIKALNAVDFTLAGAIEDPAALLSRGQLDIVLHPETRLALDGLSLANGIAVPDRIELGLAETASRVSWNLNDAAPTVDINLAALSGHLRTAGPDGFRIYYRLPKASFASDGRDGFTARLEGARFDFPAQKLSLSDVAATVSSSPEGLNATVERAVLRDDAKPAAFAPLQIVGNAAAKGDELTFDARGTAVGGAFKARIDGRHDLASGKGAADLRVDEVAFKPGELQPGDLSPRAAGFVQRVEGAVAVESRLHWGGTGSGSESTTILHLNGVNFDAQAGRVNALKGDIVIEGLESPSTPPHQRLDAVFLPGSLEPIPIEIAFQLHDTDRLTLERIAIDFAEGTISASDVSFDQRDTAVALTLDVAHLDLGRIFELIDVDGLSGSGLLTGAIPVRASDAGLAIAEGTLRSEGAGTVRYKGSELAERLAQQGEHVKLAVQALTNFHYEELSLTLNKDLKGEGSILLSFLGSNPETLDGHPFRFNITLESNFDQLAALVLQGLGAANNLLDWAAGTLKKASQ